MGAGLAGVAALASGCVREPAERLCPELTTGDLVLSELAGGGAGAPEGSWIELYNGSGAELDLLGARVRLRRLDGGAEQALLVRRSVTVAAAGYVALSLRRDDERPAGFAYGLADLEPAALYPAGEVSVESCERSLDRARYAALPAASSLARVRLPPRAEDDDAAPWCEAPGTAGRENAPCR